MFKISKDSIKCLATDEAAYFRGLRYYKENAVSNVTWSKTSRQYRATVKGSNQYLVTIYEGEQGQIIYKCNCPSHIKHKGACKHVIAALLFISNYVERSEERKLETEEEKKLYHIIEYFDNQIKSPLIGETFCVECTIHFPEIIQGKESRVFLSLRAGSSRLYKVQNIKKFLNNLLKDENIILGKEFKFIAGESRFDKNTGRVISYLTQIYEIQEALGKVYYNNLFNKSEMALTSSMFNQLLDCMNDQEFCIELYGEFYNGIKYKKENPPIVFQIESEENNISIELKGKKPVRPLAKDGSFLFYENVLYHPHKEFLVNYLPFFNLLKPENQSLSFQGGLKEQFIESVLPRIHETMEINVPDNLKSKYIHENLIIKIYLDKYKKYIRAGVIFQYGQYEINPLLNNIPAGIILVRKKEEENNCLDYMEELHFEPFKEFFLLKKDSNIYDFLNQGIYVLNEKYQVFHSEDMKSFKSSQGSTMRTSIGFNENIKLLEMNIEYDAVPKSELKAFFESLKQKKKFYRLKNGSFADLSGVEIDQIGDFLSQLDMEGEHMDTNGSIKLPVRSAMYLNQVLENYDKIEFHKTSSYNRLLEDILQPKSVSIEVPALIQAKLRPYQVAGFKWLYVLADKHLGGILADDMGLGKTLMTIAYIALWIQKDSNAKFLVVAPTSLVFNWQDEMEKFAPSISIQIIEGAPEDRQKMIEDAFQYNVVFTSYPLIRRDIEYYKKMEFHTMFIDEGQYIKNPQSQNAKSVKQVNAKHKFALTGTPIENSLSELWSLFDYIMPDYLYSHSRFIQKFEKPIMKELNKVVLDDLGKHIEPFILRRMKKDVLTELPDKIEVKMTAEMTAEQEKIYYAYLQNIKQKLTVEIHKKGIEKSRIEILAALTRLRQICCHPSIFVDEYKGGSGKLKLLLQVISDVLENGHRILVFSQFTTMLDLIATELEKREIDYFYLSGATKMKERQTFVSQFNKGERSMFLISLKAGGTGLNLVGADVVIHFDPWWNPAVEEQATDRVYRIGQKKSVQVIRLLTKNTIEEKIDRLQKRKKQLSDSVIKSKEVFINQLSREELEELFL